MKKGLAAQELTKQRATLTPTNLHFSVKPQDEDAGYRLQEEVRGLLTKAGLGTPVGHKIGCTTSVMQKFLGIQNPCAGIVFQNTVGQNSIEIPANGFIKLGIECEIGVYIKSDILPENRPYDAKKLEANIGSVMVAMEIVDDRYLNYRQLGVPTLIADNFFNCGCVLGERKKNWRNIKLDEVVGTTKINGNVVGTGLGEAVMGHPLNALSWLANNRSMRGLGIKKGEFVLLGSVVETKWLAKGDHAEIFVDQLGSVSAFIS